MAVKQEKSGQRETDAGVLARLGVADDPAEDDFVLIQTLTAALEQCEAALAAELAHKRPWWIDGETRRIEQALAAARQALGRDEGEGK